MVQGEGALQPVRGDVPGVPAPFGCLPGLVSAAVIGTGRKGAPQPGHLVRCPRQRRARQDPMIMK